MNPKNIAVLEDTLKIIEKGSYQVQEETVCLKLSREQMEDVSVFLPEDVERIGRAADFEHVHTARPCQYSCENADSFSLAQKRAAQYAEELAEKDAKPILVLNLANPVNPGGGARKGSSSQEEELCRRSTLLVSLEGEKARPYYQYNRSLNTYMGSDAVMIHPQVEIIKDEGGVLKPETVLVAVMTCAAPMITFGMEGMTEEQYEEMVYHRITGMLKVAAYLGYRRLVLGAFGCGAFENDARVVSDLFYKALKNLDFDGMKENELFRSIDFAVLCRPKDLYNYHEFRRNFSCFYTDDLEEDHATDGRPAPVFFWKEDEENGCFSNWYRRSFVIDDFEYLHVEQYMMAQKAKLFHDSKRYTAILRAAEPWECKALGRDVKPFDAKTWDSVKYEIVKTANRAKFEQNPDLKAKLLGTGDAILAEASPKDRVWGIGLEASAAADTDPAEWPGQNLLGKILMELRAEM